MILKDSMKGEGALIFWSSHLAIQSEESGDKAATYQVDEIKVSTFTYRKTDWPQAQRLHKLFYSLSLLAGSLLHYLLSRNFSEKGS